MAGFGAICFGRGDLGEAMNGLSWVTMIASEGAVPNLLWLVLLGGAVITIGYTFFFGAESLRAQALMTALLAIMISSELLVIIGIDRPFSGAIKVGPNALAAVIAEHRLSPQ